jgi:hypothetical protein
MGTEAGAGGGVSHGRTLGRYAGANSESSRYTKGCVILVPRVVLRCIWPFHLVRLSWSAQTVLGDSHSNTTAHQRAARCKVAG